MGFFDKFMRALGFASEDEINELGQKRKKAPKDAPEKVLKNEYNLEADASISSFTPSSQEEVKQIAELVKSGVNVKINFVNFDKESFFRAIDFLDGFCYALDITPSFDGFEVTLAY